MKVKVNLIRAVGKSIERLPLPRRRFFEALVDFVYIFRFVSDRLKLAKLTSTDTVIKNYIDRDAGWAKFEFNEKITSHLINIAKQARDDYLNAEIKQINKKEYLQQILNIEKIASEHPEVLHFALDESLLKSIGNYFGRFPILHDISVFYSPPTKSDSDEWQGSQLFHRDGGGTRCFKLWLLCEAVSIHNGPTTLLPSKISDEICQNLDYVPGKKFQSDEPLDKYLSESIRLIGPAGSWFATDTDRCLHYGSRTAEVSSRLVMMFHYVDRNSVYYLPIINKHYRRFRSIDFYKFSDKLSQLSLSAIRWARSRK